MCWGRRWRAGRRTVCGGRLLKRLGRLSRAAPGHLLKGCNRGCAASLQADMALHFWHLASCCQAAGTPKGRCRILVRAPHTSLSLGKNTFNLGGSQQMWCRGAGSQCAGSPACRIFEQRSAGLKYSASPQQLQAPHRSVLATASPQIPSPNINVAPFYRACWPCDVQIVMTQVSRSLDGGMHLHVVRVGDNGPPCGEACRLT